jgi:16S rRNA (guanine966-N2)-methyltransferase
VRESLFASLGDLTGVRVLDLFAGSGALGVEALSRGAAHVVFVESAAGVVATLRANLVALELAEYSEVLRTDAARALPRLAARGDVFELILLDPPYASDLASQTLEGIARHGLLGPAGVVVVETDRRSSRRSRGARARA